MNERLRENVARGVKLLDEKDPEWFLKIDLSHLKLKDSCRCVLGQLCSTQAEIGLYSSGYTWAMMNWRELRGENGIGSDFGFEVDDEIGILFPEQYAILDELWIEAIKEKFEEGVDLGLGS